MSKLSVEREGKKRKQIQLPPLVVSMGIKQEQYLDFLRFLFPALRDPHYLGERNEDNGIVDDRRRKGLARRV